MAFFPLPKFNPDARFEAARPFVFNGVPYQPGDEVTGVILGRRLRQMYDQRDLREVDPAVPAPKGAGLGKHKKQDR